MKKICFGAGAIIAVLKLTGLSSMPWALILALTFLPSVIAALLGALILGTVMTLVLFSDIAETITDVIKQVLGFSASLKKSPKKYVKPYARDRPGSEQTEERNTTRDGVVFKKHTGSSAPSSRRPQRPPRHP